jgi:hypothetical protein
MIPDDLQLSPEDLMSVWGKVGVHICEAATTMYDKSKKSLIGDGSFHSFVDLAIKQVPSALYPLDGPSTYGYLIYQQMAGSVQKRVADIMPGDIVCLSDARFKGHKGLQAYHINVGEDGIPLVGVVTDFDPRKSKLRVLQANQHVGQQVRLPSYPFFDTYSFFSCSFSFVSLIISFFFSLPFLHLPPFPHFPFSLQNSPFVLCSDSHLFHLSNLLHLLGGRAELISI